MWAPRVKIAPMSLGQKWTADALRLRGLRCLKAQPAAAGMATHARSPGQEAQRRPCNDQTSAVNPQIKRAFSSYDRLQTRSFLYGASPEFQRGDGRGSFFLQPRHGTTILCVRKGDEVVSFALAKQARRLLPPQAI